MHITFHVCNLSFFAQLFFLLCVQQLYILEGIIILLCVFFTCLCVCVHIASWKDEKSLFTFIIQHNEYCFLCVCVFHEDILLYREKSAYAWCKDAKILQTTLEGSICAHFSVMLFDIFF